MMQLCLGPRLRRTGKFRDRAHGPGVTIRVARRVVLAARRLPQHIEREAIAQSSFGLGVGKRLLNGLAEHELIAQDTHRLAQRLANHLLAASRDQALDHARQVDLSLPAPIEDAPGKHQAPGRSVDQERVGVAEMARPVA